MSESVPCGRCGAPRQRMRLPDDWNAETVASWRSLEERFVCDECEALVVEWVNEGHPTESKELHQ